MKFRMTPHTCELLSIYTCGDSSYKLLHEGYGDSDTIKLAIKELSNFSVQYKLKLSNEDCKDLDVLISSLQKLIK